LQPLWQQAGILSLFALDFQRRSLMLRIKYGIALLIALLLVGLLPLVAFAASPHFTSVSASNSGPGNLTVTFTEAGLGDNVLINYEASANGTAMYACINGGNKHPEATNKETVSGPLSALGTFSSGKNGMISASLLVSPPPPGSFTCPSGQTLVLAFVSYTTVGIADTTNSVSQGIPGTFSECLVDPALGLCP
jgi:hypothetical protein